MSDTKATSRQISIVQEPHPVLRGKAEEVALQDIQTPRIQKIIADMKKALASQDDGVAIAAPQIGVPLRIFVVAERALQRKDAALTGVDTQGYMQDLVCINPKITKRSKDKKWLQEGCLSVRYLYGKVHRHAKVTLEAYNDMGQKFTRGASGLLAQIFQHEHDHLDGILFIDSAKDVEDLPPEHQQR